MPIADLRKLDIDEEKLRALGPRERYVFALAGHVFNEVMTLQKLVLTVGPKSPLHEYEQEGRVGMTILLLKLLVGKVHEAMDALTRHSVAHVLKEAYFNSSPGLQRRWDNAVAKYQSLAWLRKIRNTASFHYMSAGQWKVLGEDNICEGAHAIVGQRYSQTFFHWQDTMAALPMMREVNHDEPFEGLGTMLDDLGELCGELCECLGLGLQRYMHQMLTSEAALGSPVELPCGYIEQTETCYFFANRDA